MLTRDLQISFDGQCLLPCVPMNEPGWPWPETKTVEKTRMKFALWSVVAVLLVLPMETRAGNRLPISFDGAMSAAKANVAEPEGVAFDAELGKEFGARTGGTMIQCTAGAGDTELATFILLMELDANGSVVRSLVRPQNKVSTCLQQAVAHQTYAKPPHAGYWVRADMQYKP